MAPAPRPPPPALRALAKEKPNVTTHAMQLDEHHGLAAQKATEIRRLLVGVEADRCALNTPRGIRNSNSLGTALTWSEAAEKARYLIRPLTATPTARDPRRKKRIASPLDDLRRLSRIDDAMAVS